MKFLKYMRLTAAITAVALIFTSCGDDEEDEPGGGSGNEGTENVGTGDPAVAAMTPTEAKNYLENTALEIATTVDPTQQEPLWQLTGYWGEEFAEFEAPTNWNLDAFEDDEDYYRAPRHNALKGFMKALGQAAKGDAGAMSKAMSEMLNMARFSGVYEPSVVTDKYGDRIETWVKTADSKDVIFRFPYKGATAELKGVAEGSTWSETYEGVTCEVPRKVTATLSDGSAVLMNATLESNLDFDAHTVSANLDATLMNITIKSVTSGDNSTVTTNTTVWYGGEQLATAAGEVKGVNMIDRNAIKNLFIEERYEYYPGYYDVWYELDTKAFGNMFKSGTVVGNVLDKVVAKGNVSNVGELAVSLGQYFDRDEFDSKSDAEQACRRQCELLNNSIPVSLYFAGSANSSATVQYQPCYEDEYGWWEWYSEPVIAFEDGSTTSFVAYFDGMDLTSLDTPITNIVNTIIGYWPFLIDSDD
ncbi:MAG: hypothetical protein HDS68_09990 [Bacteroidales bacterium]|nr:hypothetical protein [Bacteroidales bacterium]